MDAPSRTSPSVAGPAEGRGDWACAADRPDGEACWFVSEEVFRSLAQIVAAIDDCAEAFPAPLHADQLCQQERFVMQQAAGPSGGDTAKCVLVMEGAAIVQAELQIKIQKHPNMIHRTTIQPEAPWTLAQLQDVANMLSEARRCAERAGRLQVLAAGREESMDAPLLRLLTGRLAGAVDELMQRLKRGRDCLLSPRKKTIEDHLNSENMRALKPPLPGDIAVSFYVQGHRLMLAVYHLVPQQGNLMFDSFLAECAIAKLETVLVGFTRAFQMCQQIKNKLYWATKCNERTQRRTPVAVQNGV